MRIRITENPGENRCSSRAAEVKVKELPREARDLAGKSKEIEDAVYDLEAVNPHKKPNVDARTPEDLMNIIGAKGKEVNEALAILQSIATISNQYSH